MSTQNKKQYRRLLIFAFLIYFSLVTGEPNGKTYPVLLKLKEVNEKNGPFSAAFVIGGPPTSEEDLSGLYDVVKSDFSSKTMNSLKQLSNSFQVLFPSIFLPVLQAKVCWKTV